MIQVNATFPTSFLLKRSPLEQQAFFFLPEKVTIFVPHMFPQPTLLHQT